MPDTVEMDKSVCVGGGSYSSNATYSMSHSTHVDLHICPVVSQNAVADM